MRKAEKAGWITAWIAVPVIAMVLAFSPLPGRAAQTEQPRRGGELVFAVGEAPPSFDGHRETTFAMLHPVGPHYSTLLRFDPQAYPKIIGDVAEDCSPSKDGLSYTCKIRQGIKFHDGSTLTSADVKATADQVAGGTWTCTIVVSPASAPESTIYVPITFNGQIDELPTEATPPPPPSGGLDGTTKVAGEQATKPVLAFTGARVWWLVALGVGMLDLGFLLLTGTRPRRART